MSKPRSKTADSISGRGSGLDLKKRLSSVVSSSLIHQENRGELVTNFHDKAVVARKQLLGNQRYSLIGDRSSRGSSTPSPALSAPSKVTVDVAKCIITVCTVKSAIKGHPIYSSELPFKAN